MRIAGLFIWFFIGMMVTVSAQLNSFPESYNIEQQDIERARQVISTPLHERVEMPNPNRHAQWFPEASLGLFMHWGILVW